MNLITFILPFFARRVLSPGYEDMEAQFAWDDKTIRQTFIRKVRCRFPPLKRQKINLEPKQIISPDVSLQVYAILMVQLLVTVGIVALFSFW